MTRGGQREGAGKPLKFGEPAKNWTIKIYEWEKPLIKSYLQRIRADKLAIKKFEKEVESNNRYFKIKKFDKSGKELENWQDYLIISFRTYVPDDGTLFAPLKLKNTLGAYGTSYEEAIKNLSKKYIPDDNLFDLSGYLH